MLLAVQDELVNLDTPITAYIPDFTVKSRFKYRPEQRITLRHLLNHTAGFTHEAPDGQLEVLRGLRRFVLRSTRLGHI